MTAFPNQHLNADHCFLCGVPLTQATRSDEHVFPVWLQNKCNLWNQKIGLQNLTSMPYCKLRIPCCNKCNNEPLSQLESGVANYLTKEYEKPTEEEEHILFQWCSKIYYGILRKEMTLLEDRKKQSGETIINIEFLKMLDMLHLFMTSIRRPFKFLDFKPYSIFVVETLEFDNPLRNFDYIDNVTIDYSGQISINLVMAIRIYNIGIICVLQDNGYQKKIFLDQFDRFDGIPLHPIQFIELSCKTMYKNSLLSSPPEYIVVSDDEHDSEVIIMQKPSYYRSEIWNEWDASKFYALFHFYAEQRGFLLPQPQESKDGEEIYTTLSDDKGNPLIISEADEKIV
jgi:hypothetical protein